jgi:hypothetical protein
MIILDYHHRTLCPSILSADELVLRPKVRAHLLQQVQARFKDAQGLLLVGDLTGHYYTADSDLDLLVVAKTPEQVKPLLQESQFVSGYLLDGTPHHVNFHILVPGTSPAALASKFGPVYDLNAGTWYGRRVLDGSEMTRVEAVMEHLSWRLYKAKGTVQLTSPKWLILKEAFSKLNTSERQSVVDHLKLTLAGLNRNIRNVIKVFNKTAVWTGAAHFAQVLDDGAGEDELTETMEKLELPTEVAAAIVNRYRYDEVLAQLETLSQKLEKASAAGVGLFSGLRTSSSQTDPMVDRLAQVLDSVVVAGGGIGTAVDSVATALESVFRSSRYLATEQRRTMVLKKLQDAFSSEDQHV